MLAPLLLSLLPFSLAVVLPRTHDHRHDDHVVQSALPGKWYHDSDHPVHALFRRQNVPTDGVVYPEVGSPTWAAPYPTYIPETTALPQDWVNALNAAVAAGKIPDIPIPSLVNSNPTYPPGTNAGSPDICSAYVQCRMPGDIWDAPAGTIGIGFDDGPSLGSAQLYDFLEQVDQRATHFMIGINILNNPALFLRAFDELKGDIAVHTWSHRYMSTLSNLDLLAEFGWSMQIIHNSTGGRLPRFWRPPYGDMDNRVRAITQEVFGLTPIIWNHDTEDWSLPTGGTTPQAINASMTEWLTGPKSPGLIILEHELTNMSAQAFQDAYPLMVSEQWKLQSVTTTNGTGVYFNSEDANSPVEPINGVIYSDVLAASSSSATSTIVPTSSSPSASPKSSGSNSASHSSDALQTLVLSKSIVAYLVGAIIILAFFA